MKTFQFEEIIFKYSTNHKWDDGRFYRFRGVSDLHKTHTDLPRMIVMRGRSKTKTGTLDGFTRSHLIIREDDGKTVQVPYASAEYQAKSGEANVAVVTDMSGREVGMGAWVTFVQRNGTNPTLCIGQVIRLSHSGEIYVNAHLRNGVKVTHAYEERVSDCNRALLLPCEGQTMTMWLLKGFEDLDETGFDPTA